MAIRSQSFRWSAEGGFDFGEAVDSFSPDLILAFASSDLAPVWLGPLREIANCFPTATLVGCSSSGGILGKDVHDAALVGLAVEFEHSATKIVSGVLEDESCAETARKLAGRLKGDDLQHVFVLTDGVSINGSEVAAALHAELGADVGITGGLAGDEARFERTRVFHDEIVTERGLVMVGIYGDRLRIGYGSVGGWDPFGPERRVTGSRDNVLFELDNSSALELYRRYLGPYAEGLPASGLKFPLSVRAAPDAPELVRTLLAIDDTSGSMVFAGDIPPGGRARLMRANFDRLVDGSQNAAENSLEKMDEVSPQLSILVSCVGRKLVLGDRIAEEVEAVAEIVGDGGAILGFYSYGELSPATSGRCELHNQTMTITTLAEV